LYYNDDEREILTKCLEKKKRLTKIMHNISGLFSACGPADATATHYLSLQSIQIGFTFLQWF